MMARQSITEFKCYSLFSNILVFVCPCLCLSPSICHCIYIFFLYYDFHDFFPQSCHIPLQVTYANYEGNTKASRVEGEERGSTPVTFQHPNQYDQGFPQWPDPGWCYAPEVAFPFIATDQLSQHTINHGTEYKYNTNTNTNTNTNIRYNTNIIAVEWFKHYNRKILRNTNKLTS